MEAALNSKLGRTPLGAGTFKIGRAPDNSLVLADPKVSSHHAEITQDYTGNAYQLTDLGSSNGTFIDDQRLSPRVPQTLRAGTIIRIGDTQFVYEDPNADAPNYEATVAAPYPQDAAFGNASSPEQPSSPPTVYAAPPSNYTPPPPAYPQAQSYPQTPSYTPPPPAYPQPQSYPQQGGYPQPGYPQQGGYPQPVYPQPGYPQQAYQQPKKRRAGCWIAAIILVLVLGIGGFFVVSALGPSPQKTLNAYCDGLKTNNAQELYNTLDKADQQKTKVSDIQQALGIITGFGGGVKDCTYSNVQVNGSTATASVTITYGSSKIPPHTDTAHLVKEDNDWKFADSGLNNTNG